MTLSSDKIALTDDVMDALAEIAKRFELKKQPNATGPNSISGLMERLYSVYEGLQQVAHDRLHLIPAYKDFNVYRSPFWHRHPNGAYLKDYLWLTVEPRKDKKAGRLQIGFGPTGTAYGEYVAYDSVLKT